MYAKEPSASDNALVVVGQRLERVSLPQTPGQSQHPLHVVPWIAEMEGLEQMVRGRQCRGLK